MKLDEIDKKLLRQLQLDGMLFTMLVAFGWKEKTRMIGTMGLEVDCGLLH